MRRRGVGEPARQVPIGPSRRRAARLLLSVIAILMVALIAVAALSKMRERAARGADSATPRTVERPTR
jgi:hypothetical protein